MAQLPLTNVVTVSVSASQAGVGRYNTSNLSIFTHEPYESSFGALGYKIYTSPLDVAKDFGSSSQTFAMANAVFSQRPNILAGNGYLVVIPMVNAIQELALSGVPASGSFTLTYDGNASAAINWDDTPSQMQSKLRAVPGLEQVLVTGTLASQEVTVSFKGIYGAVPLLVVGGAGLQTSAPAAITITPTTATAGETISEAITRTSDLVQYFGLMGTLVFDEVDTLAAAAVIQPLNKIGFFVGNDPADVEIGGKLDLLRSGNFSQSRGIYYGDTDETALLVQAAYAGRGLSTNFDGSNTTQTMNLKDLLGVQPDSSMTETLLGLCQDAGADVYVSLQGVPKVLCSGENMFFDQIYNQLWFVGALQVAVFNYLAQSSTKIPQTEQGMDGLKGAIRKVCDQAVTNQYLAPGVWNDPTTFGNQANFNANIEQFGYYIYSLPIGQQSQAAREEREAPLVQVAGKEAGAIHKANIIVFLNP